MNTVRRLLSKTGDDRGVTLAELAVTTGIMAVVMAIFTTGVVQLFRSGNNAETVALTQSQLSTAFLRLDRELRYSGGFSTPRRDVSGNWFVEYVNTGNTTPVAGGTYVPECAQLELYTAAGTLRRRRWWQTGQKPDEKWTVLASDVDVGRSGFAPGDALADSLFQRLKVTLAVTTHAGPSAPAASSVVTFTALNSKAGTDPNTICPEARS